MRARGGAGRHLRALAAGLRGWTALLLVGPAARLVVVHLGDPARSWGFIRRAIRAIARLSGVPLAVEGAPPPGGSVLVVNHESYLDGAILIAACRAPREIAVGAVLERQRLPGPLLQAIGCLFVASDAESARAQLGRLVGAAERGRLAIFPEGHLIGGDALGRFHLGGFVAAAAAHLPVVPVAICGSRAVLPPGARWPRRGRIVVRFGAPLVPMTTGFGEARRLASAAEQAVLELRSH